jgi:hypothetical protein
MKATNETKNERTREQREQKSAACIHSNLIKGDTFIKDSFSKQSRMSPGFESNRKKDEAIYTEKIIPVSFGRRGSLEKG